MTLSFSAARRRRGAAGGRSSAAGGGGNLGKFSQILFFDPVSRSYAEPKMADPHLCYEGHNIGVDRPFYVNIKWPIYTYVMRVIT